MEKGLYGALSRERRKLFTDNPAYEDAQEILDSLHIKKQA
jgi:hypothetical protein